MQTTPISEFKARCLALIEGVSRTGEPLLILKHGRPIAQVVPAPPGDGAPQDALKGSVQFLGDVISPAVPVRDWDLEKGKL